MASRSSRRAHARLLGAEQCVSVLCSTDAADLALLRNNADVAAQIAVALAGPAAPAHHQPAITSLPTPASPSTSLPKPKILVVGIAAVDITARADLPLADTTSPGSVALTLGGVGRNVAEAATRLSADRNDVQLVAAVASDALGALVRQKLGASGMRTDGLIDIGEGGRTPTCSIVLDQGGQLVGGVADMNGADLTDVARLRRSIGDAAPRLIVFDGNVSRGVMDVLLSSGVPSASAFPGLTDLAALFECTSDSKATAILPAFAAGQTVSYATPNIHELRAMFDAGKASGLFESPAFWTALDALGIDADFSTSLPTRLPSWIAREGLVQMGACRERRAAMLTLQPLICCRSLARSSSSAASEGC